MALLACVVVSDTDGLPLDPFATLLAPTPSLPENLTTFPPKKPSPPLENDVVIVSLEGATYAQAYAVV